MDHVFVPFQSPTLESAMTSYNVSEGQRTKKWPQYVAALAATGGALAAGTALGWTSPANPILQNTSSTTDPNYDFILNDEEASWVGSSLNLGAAAVCIPIGILLNAIGRKWTMLSLVIPFTIGWALIIWAQNLSMLIVGRVFLGISSGAFCVTSPVSFYYHFTNSLLIGIIIQGLYWRNCTKRNSRNTWIVFSTHGHDWNIICLWNRCWIKCFQYQYNLWFNSINFRCRFLLYAW